jgi:hypothetical protein
MSCEPPGHWSRSQVVHHGCRRGSPQKDDGALRRAVSESGEGEIGTCPVREHRRAPVNLKYVSKLRELQLTVTGKRRVNML